MDPMARVRHLTSDADTSYGCAEATLVALKEHFDLPNPTDSAEAMALNGGIAYSGGTCGAITGAVLALGGVADRRIPNHSEAKKLTRRIVQRVMGDFAAEFGSVRCRELTGFDLARDHDGFIASGVWETRCMAQMAFVIDRITPLEDPERWEAMITTVGDDELPMVSDDTWRHPPDGRSRPEVDGPHE